MHVEGTYRKSRFKKVQMYFRWYYRYTVGGIHISYLNGHKNDKKETSIKMLLI